MSFNSAQYLSTLPKYLFPLRANTRQVLKKFRGNWTGLTQSCPLHTHAVDSALTQGEECSHYYISPQNRTVSGGWKRLPRLWSCSTTLFKKWNDLTSDSSSLSYLCCLLGVFKKSQQNGIDVHNRDQVHVSVIKKSTFPIWPKETSLFLRFADYLQFRISMHLQSAKSQGKYHHYITKCTLREHFLCVTLNGQDQSKTETQSKKANLASFKATPILNTETSTEGEKLFPRPALLFAPAPRPPVTGLVAISEQLRKI